MYISEDSQKTYRVGEISDVKLIPKSFLAKILQKLVKAGVVESIRGAKGGFRLVRKPSEITIFDIIEIMEGPIIMNSCAMDKASCDLSNTCSIHPVWVDIRKKIVKQLKETNFKDLTYSDNNSLNLYTS